MNRLACACLLLLSCAAPLFAAGTATWSRDGIEFQNGSLEGMMISPSGALTPRPEAQWIERPLAPLIWDLLVDGDGVWVAGGGGGGLVRYGAGGKQETVAGWPADPETLALARGPYGDLFAASGPGGAVYRIEGKELRAQEIFRPACTYIWDLLALPNGELIVATGLPGKVFKIDPRRAEAPPEVLWETQDPHVRSLALGSRGTILAGTSGSGWIVELDGKGGAFVLWDADRPEVVALSADRQGAVWAAVSGAPSGAAAPSGQARRPESPGANAAAAAAKMRAEEAALGGKEEKDSRGEGTKTPEPTGGGGDLLRLVPGRAAETLWMDKQETPLALAPWAGGMLMGTAFPGRIWVFDDQGRPGLWDERRESRAASALASEGTRLAAGLSNPAGILIYGPGLTPEARWTSEVIDARKFARWGRVRAFAAPEAARQVKVEARAGNTAEPGPEWTPWTAIPGAAGPPEAEGQKADLPAARFFQVRVTGNSGPAPVEVPFVELRYRPQNLPPRIDSLDVLPPGVAFRSLPPAALASGDVPVVPPPRAPEAEELIGETRPAWRSKKVYEPGARTLVWQAKDPDGDPLQFTVEVRPERGGPAGTWTVLAARLEQGFFSFDSRTLPDGVYRFRLKADDAVANAWGEGASADEISAPVTIDNTAPQIQQWQFLSQPGGKVQLKVTAVDPGGRLAGAQVWLEPGRPVELAPEDGVGDAAAETFSATLGPLAPGALVAVQVVDAAGNPVTGQRPVPPPPR